MAKAAKTEGSFKIKNTKKTKEAEVKESPAQTGPAVINEETGNIKLDLTKKPEQDANTKQEAADVVTDKQAEPVQEVEKEIPQQPEPVQAEESVPEKPVEETVLEEITEEKKEEITQEVTQELKEDVAEAIAEQKESGIELPENIQKVVD